MEFPDYEVPADEYLLTKIDQMFDAAEWNLDSPEHLYCVNTHNNLMKYRTHYWLVLLDKPLTFFLNYSAYSKTNQFCSVLRQKEATLAWYKFWFFDLPKGNTTEYDSDYYAEYDD